MRKTRLTGLVLLAAALWSMSGCVELTGQRISWFYDAVKDELQVLIHYDGIHDSGSSQHGKGIEQIPEFVRSGNVLIFDWPFHLEMGDVRKTLGDESADPRKKQWCRLIASIKTKPIGYYREPNGRIGAAQLVTIPKARQFVRQLNEMINLEVAEETVPPDEPLARTHRRMQAAAKKGHQWLQLDGHAIRLQMPVHPEEWAVVKGEFLQELARSIVVAAGENNDKDPQNLVNMVLKALASVPVSYLDEGDRVTFVVGRPKVPSTVRLDVRGEYETSLEEVVRDTVKIDLDQAAAAVLLDDGAEGCGGLSAVLSFGPPEERVRALLAAAEGQSGCRRRAALKQLGLWASQWNCAHGVPKAPQEVDEFDDYLAAWKRWYARMKQFPVFIDQSDADKPAESTE